MQAILCGTLNIISDGMQVGWTSPMVPRFQTTEASFQITETDVTWLEIIFMLAGLISTPITIYLVDRIGRKLSVLMASALCLVGWSLIGAADSVLYLYTGRFINGLSCDIGFICSPIYIAEIAHQKIRGFLSCFIYIQLFTGILLIYTIGPFVPVHVPSIVGCCILLIQLLTFSFMPESPYYLLYKDRMDDAQKALMFFRNSDETGIKQELKDIADAIQRQKSEPGKLLDLFAVKSNRKAVIILTVLNASQHVAGVTVMMMNVHSVLTAAESIYMPAETSAILFGGLMLASMIICLVLVDVFGRKTMLINSAVISGSILLVMAIFLHLKQNQVDVSSLSWIPVLCVMLYAVSFKAGLGIIPIILSAELFPARMKALGNGYAEIVYNFSSVISIYVYHYLVDILGICFPFYIFSICCFLTGIFTFFFIPETRGKTLEEIQIILKG